MRVGRIIVLSAAGLLGLCGAGFSVGANASGGVEFHKTIAPGCTVFASKTEFYYAYEEGTLLDQPDGRGRITEWIDGHVTVLSREEQLDFDCNTDTVDVAVKVDSTPPPGIDAVHTVSKVAAVAGSGAPEQDLLGAAVETQTRTEVQLNLAQETATTSENGDVGIRVGSMYTPQSGVEELMSSSYEYVTVFTITLTTP